MAVVILVTAVISAFMNNTPQVVLMIPILTAVALRSGMSPSKLLMPMTFASQIGGMGTPIGTSLNLLVIGSAASSAWSGSTCSTSSHRALVAGGVLFLWLVAPRLLPDRETQFTDTSPRVFHAVCSVNEGASYANGRTIAEVCRKQAAK